MKSLERDVATNFYRMGLCLRELEQPQVYGALGFATFEDLLTTLDLGGRYRAHQLIEVVDTLPEPLARDLGSSKSYQAIRYVKLVEPDRAPGPFIASDPPVVVDGRRVPLSVISVRESSPSAPAPHRVARRAPNASPAASASASSTPASTPIESAPFAPAPAGSSTSASAPKKPKSSPTCSASRHAESRSRPVRGRHVQRVA